MRRRQNPEPDAPADEAAPDDEAAIDEPHVVSEAPTADTEAEFHTDWHRERYIADCERELAGAERRLEELQALSGASEEALADQQAMIDNASAELARVTKKGRN